jgi:Chromosome segregation ATPases
MGQQEAFNIQLREEPKTELLSLPTLAHAINTEAAEVNRRAEIIGNYLNQAKQQLPDDSSFMSWVAETCPFSHSTALGLMKYARGLCETPSLIGKPKSIVLEVMKLPATEREEFLEENDGKSVRQLRQAIEERDRAQREKKEAERAYSLVEEAYEKTSGEMQRVSRENESLLRQVEQLKNAPSPDPITETVEVPPADYEQVKQAAQRAEAEKASLRAQAREAEEYAEEQEALRKQAESELRRVKTSDENGEKNTEPFSASALSVSFKGFLSDVGTMPHMAAFFQTMPPEELQTVKTWLDVFGEWLNGTIKAVNAGSRFVDVDCTVE